MAKVKYLEKTKERSLKITPSWAVAVVVFVILAISIALEYILHLIGHWLQHKQKKSLHEALEKIKAELMLLGFISLLLTVGQEPIASICIPSKVARTWHPCNDDSADTDFYDPCLKKGKVQMVSNYGIHQLHIFLFVLAVVHVAYCLLTLGLGRLKMRRWKTWEDETRTFQYQYHNDPERFRFARETTFGRRHLRSWSTSTILLWIGCFFRQFFTSVAKIDYLTLRHGFINTHLTPESQHKFDFHKYITKNLEEDFKEVVGIRITTKNGRKMKRGKSERILRIKAKSFSNEKSAPIVCEEEESEYNEETDNELSLTKDKAVSHSEMDAEIERQLDESRKKKLKKRAELNELVREYRRKKLSDKPKVKESREKDKEEREKETLKKDKNKAGAKLQVVEKSEAKKDGKEGKQKESMKTVKQKRSKEEQIVVVHKGKKDGKEEKKGEGVKIVKENPPKELKQVLALEETGSKKRKIEKVETKGKKQKTEEGTTKGKKKTSPKSSKTKEKIVNMPVEVYSIRTRASPKKLYDCVMSLTEKQKKIVKEMGFGKLLKMVVNSIPGKLGYFVVDNFDPNTMEIKFGRLSIKVDEESIHQLLGVPNKGIDLTTFKVSTDETPLGTAYKKRYNNKPTLSTKDVLTKITTGEDNEGFMFKVDFIIIFFTTMVECHLNGLCKTGIVDILNEDMDFSNINWCKYIVYMMKRCKRNWVQKDLSCFFRGALTILTLLYVDSVTCKGINEIRTVNALQFWTMQRLQLREDMELENGGFGKGDYRGLFVDEEGSDEEGSEESDSEADEKEQTQDEEQSGPEDETSLEKQFRKVGTYYYWLEKNKKNFEISIEKLQKKYPEREEVNNFVEQYKEKLRKLFIEEKVETPKTTDGERLDLIVQSIGLLDEIENQTPKTKELTVANEGKSESVQLIASQPSFNLGISPIELSLEEINDGVDNDLQNQENPNGRPQRSKHPTYATKSPFVIREVDICKPLTKEEERIWKYLMESSNVETDEKVKAEKLSQDNKDGCKVNKEAKEVEADFEDNVFETVYGHTTKRFLLKSLEKGVTVLNNVIDCWAAVLNHDEEIRGPDSDKRLFCDTNLMTEEVLTNEKMSEAARLQVIRSNMSVILKGTEFGGDLKNADLVLIPILEKNHYYLVCFDLQNLVIEVIDNIHESKSFVTLDDDNDYKNKDTVLKVKHMFIAYLKSVGNSKWEDFQNVKPVRLSLPWATKKNSVDCGVFVMRHMEMYKKSSLKNWQCGFKAEKTNKQKQQLNLLRRKYAVKMLLSKANIHRESVMKKALEFAGEVVVSIGDDDSQKNVI